jgi:uncharacterized membrane protein YeaQ/YmgE (transglycosylase-associated protein family)
MAPADPNPYAPPTGADAPAAAKKKKKKRGGYAARFAGADLVLSGGGELPSVCMKCGTHDGIMRRSAKLQWTPVWARFLVFCVIGAVVMLVTTKRATLDVPLCVPCNERWNAARGATVVAVVGLVAAFLWLRLGPAETTKAALVALVVAIAGFIVVLVSFVKPRTLRATNITDSEITLRGVDPRAAQEIVDGSR